MKVGETSVSIVIPCYNDGKFLLDAVMSAEGSVETTCEVIVVNDGSTEALTMEVLAAVERRGHRVVHQRNLGLAAARNRGINLARGSYILPLDADNRIRPEYPKRGREILDRNAAIDVVYGDRSFFGDHEGLDTVGEFNLARLLTWNYIDACAVLRKSAWERCGGYDEAMPSAGFEDWDLWCRIACSGGGFHYLPEALYEYRVRSGSMSAGMATEARVRAIMRHIRAKRIELTMGEYVDAFHSWDTILSRFRARPFRTVAGLLLRAYLPHWSAQRRSRINARKNLQTAPTA